jgi:hypothetical protein
MNVALKVYGKLSKNLYLLLKYCVAKFIKKIQGVKVSMQLKGLWAVFIPTERLINPMNEFGKLGCNFKVSYSNATIAQKAVFFLWIIGGFRNCSNVADQWSSWKNLGNATSCDLWCVKLLCKHIAQWPIFAQSPWWTNLLCHTAQECYFGNILEMFKVTFK